MKIIETKETPICPYCKKELESVYTAIVGKLLTFQSRVYLCPHCKSLLGIAP